MCQVFNQISIIENLNIDSNTSHQIGNFLSYKRATSELKHCPRCSAWRFFYLLLSLILKRFYCKAASQQCESAIEIHLNWKREQPATRAGRAGWDPAPDIPISTCGNCRVSGGVSELKRATIYPRGRKASGGGRGREASGCISQFRRGQQHKKTLWKRCRQQLSAWPLRFLQHTNTHTFRERDQKLPYGTTMDIWKGYRGDNMVCFVDKISWRRVRN